MSSETNTYLVLHKSSPGGLWQKGGYIQAESIAKAYRSCVMSMFGVDAEDWDKDRAVDFLDNRLVDLQLYPVKTNYNNEPVFSSIQKMKDRR